MLSSLTLRLWMFRTARLIDSGLQVISPLLLCPQLVSILVSTFSILTVSSLNKLSASRTRRSLVAPA